MSNELIERLKSYIPSGDGHNSQYANDLADAVVFLKAKAAPVGERDAFMELWSRGKFEPAFKEDFELCRQCFQAGATHQRQQAREVVVPDINELVNRFLSWPLPESLCSDPCASMPGYPHRTGTNLMTAEQAMAMFGHVLAHLKDKEVLDGH